jgi:hypothetical protein
MSSCAQKERKLLEGLGDSLWHKNSNHSLGSIRHKPMVHTQGTELQKLISELGKVKQINYFSFFTFRMEWGPRLQWPILLSENFSLRRHWFQFKANENFGTINFFFHLHTWQYVTYVRIIIVPQFVSCLTHPKKKNSLWCNIGLSQNL